MKVLGLLYLLIILTLMPSCCQMVTIIRQLGQADIFTNPTCLVGDCRQKQATMSPYDQCDCQCQRNTDTFSQQQQHCISNFPGCVNVTLGSSGNVHQIEAISVPLSGTDITPLRPLFYGPSREERVSLGWNYTCQIDNVNYLAPDNTWKDISTLLTTAAVRLQSDNGDIFLKWSDSKNEHTKIDGQLLQVHLKCHHVTIEPHLTRQLCLALKASGKITFRDKKAEDKGLTINHIILISVLVPVAILLILVTTSFCLWRWRTRKKAETIKRGNTNPEASKEGDLNRKTRKDSNMDKRNHKVRQSSQNEKVNLNGVSHGGVGHHKEGKKNGPRKPPFPTDIVRPMMGGDDKKQGNPYRGGRYHDALSKTWTPGSMNADRNRILLHRNLAEDSTMTKQKDMKVLDPSAMYDGHHGGTSHRKNQKQSGSVSKSAFGSIRKLFSSKQQGNSKHRKKMPYTLSGALPAISEEYLDRYGTVRHHDGFILMDEISKRRFLQEREAHQQRSSMAPPPRLMRHENTDNELYQYSSCTPQPLTQNISAQTQKSLNGQSSAMYGMATNYNMHQYGELNKSREDNGKTIKPVNVHLSDQDDSGYHSSPLATPTGGNKGMSGYNTAMLVPLNRMQEVEHGVEHIGQQPRPRNTGVRAPITNIDDLGTSSESDYHTGEDTSKDEKALDGGLIEDAPTQSNVMSYQKDGAYARRDILDLESKYKTGTTKKQLARSFDAYKRPAQFVDHNKNKPAIIKNQKGMAGSRDSSVKNKINRNMGRKSERPQSAITAEKYVINQISSTDMNGNKADRPKSVLSSDEATEKKVKGLRERFEAFLHIQEENEGSDAVSKQKRSLQDTSSSTDTDTTVGNNNKGASKKSVHFHTEGPKIQEGFVLRQAEKKDTDYSTKDFGIEYCDNNIWHQPSNKAPPGGRFVGYPAVNALAGDNSSVFDTHKQTTVARDMSQLLHDDKIEQRTSGKSLKFGNSQVHIISKV